MKYFSRLREFFKMIKLAVTSKRSFFIALFVLFFLLTFSPFIIFSQEILTSQPRENILPNIGQPTSPLEVILKNQGEEFPLPFPQYPFLATLKKVITPGQIKLDEYNLNLIYEFQLNNGIKNFTTLASLLVNESQKAIRKGEKYEAIRLANAAKRLAPEFPQPYWALAQAYGAESKLRVYRILKEYFEGNLIAIKNFKSLMLLSCNTYFIFFFAFFLTFFTFSLILLVKYFNLIAKDCGDFFSKKTFFLPGYIWAAILASFPLILGIGPILVACYWLLILVIYVSKKEKHVIFIFSLLLILSPWGFENVSSLLLANQDGLLNLLHRANFEDWSPETENKLEAYLANHPQDPNVLFTMGLLKKRWGSLEEAKRYYQTLHEMYPSSPVIINNLGSVYFAQGELQQAEETFKKAIELNYKKASFHFNLYWTYLELYKFLEARKREELLIAWRLDPELVDYQKKIYRPNVPNRILIDETLTFKELWNSAFQGSEEKENTLFALWTPFFKGISHSYGVFFFIVFSFLIFFLIFHQDSAKKFSTRCNKCGKPIKRKVRLSQGSKSPEICSYCVSIYIQNINDKKFERFEKHQTLIWKILTYGLPGGGHVWVGFPFFGIIYLFVFFCFFLEIIFWNGLVKDPFFLAYSSSFLRAILFAFAFLLFYFFVAKQSNQKKRTSEKIFEQTVEVFRSKNQKQIAQTQTKDMSNNEGKDEPWL